MLHQEVERHGDDQCTQSPDEVNNRGLEEEPERNDHGNDRDGPTERQLENPLLVGVSPPKDNDGQAGRNVLGKPGNGTDLGQGIEGPRVSQ